MQHKTGGRLMNPEQMTQKTQLALQEAQQSMEAAQHAELTASHVLRALLRQPDGIVPPVVEAAGANSQRLLSAVEQAISGISSVQGGAAQRGISRNLQEVLQAAQQRMTQMGDSYLSTEHLLLGMLDKPSATLSEIFNDHQLTTQAVETAIQSIRGRNTVNDQHPEDKMDVLEKYGRDLTQDARDQKLDPVIGRDGPRTTPSLSGNPGSGKRPSPKGSRSES